MSFSLTYLDRQDIKDEDEGLSEPSGLALSNGHDGFWTVSDDTKKVFKLDREGSVVGLKSVAPWRPILHLFYWMNRLPESTRWR